MKKLLVFSVCFFLLLLMVGCESDAEVEEEKVPEVEPPVVVDPPVIEEPPVVEVIPEDFTERNDALIDTILSVREKAIESGVENYFSKEFLELDTIGQDALSTYENGGDGKEFFDFASAILPKYETLESATVVMNAREKAIEAGAEEFFKNELQVIDIFASEALSVYQDGGVKEDFDIAANNSLYQYKALEKATMIAIAQNRVDELNFKKYNPEAYAMGVEYSNNAMELFNTGADGEILFNETVNALNEFESILATGFTTLAKDEREVFLDVTDRADLIKASVADKDNYLNAKKTFSDADNEINSLNPEKAHELYKIAVLQMTDVHNTVYDKRKAAENYLNRAYESVERSEEIAGKADILAPEEEVDKLRSDKTANEGDE